MLASILLFAASEPTVVVKLRLRRHTKGQIRDAQPALSRRLRSSRATAERGPRPRLRLLRPLPAHEFGIARATRTQPSAGSALPRRGDRRRSSARWSRRAHRSGLPAVHCRRFRSGASARAPTRASAKAGASQCRALLRAGLLPVLHGDSVLDDARGCAILSGDELLEALCDELRPKLAVFLTDVAGVFDKPPSESGAALIPEIRVRRNGALVIPSGGALTTSSRAHDVSGGLAAKLQSAAKIAARGTPVVIVQAGTRHAAEALAGRWPAVGTRVLRIRGGALAPPALPTALQRRWRAAFGLRVLRRHARGRLPELRRGRRVHGDGRRRRRVQGVQGPEESCAATASRATATTSKGSGGGWACRTKTSPRKRAISSTLVHGRGSIAEYEYGIRYEVASRLSKPAKPSFSESHYRSSPLYPSR